MDQKATIPWVKTRESQPRVKERRGGDSRQRPATFKTENEKRMTDYISINEQMPDFLEHEPHAQKLILLTKSYGEFLGFYDGEHFRADYATILENVTHWCYCPKRPDGK